MRFGDAKTGMRGDERICTICLAVSTDTIPEGEGCPGDRQTECQ